MSPYLQIIICQGCELCRFCMKKNFYLLNNLKKNFININWRSRYLYKNHHDIRKRITYPKAHNKHINISLKDLEPPTILKLFLVFLKMETFCSWPDSFTLD